MTEQTPRPTDSTSVSTQKAIVRMLAYLESPEFKATLVPAKHDYVATVSEYLKSKSTIESANALIYDDEIEDDEAPSQKKAQVPLTLPSGKVITEYLDTSVVHNIEDLSPQVQSWILDEDDDDLFFD